MKLRLPNDTKIKFCNAMFALGEHRLGCTRCDVYLRHGDGDLCNEGQRVIAIEMAYADTFPGVQERSSAVLMDRMVGMAVLENYYEPRNR